MHTLGYSSRSAQLLEAVKRAEVAALYIEGNRTQGRLPIPHLSAHLLQQQPHRTAGDLLDLLQPPPREEAVRRSLQSHDC
jgi:hypothetical protein